MAIPGSKSKRRKVAVANEATAHLVAVLGVAALLVARQRVAVTKTTMTRKAGMKSNGVQVYMRTLSIWRCSKKCEGVHPRPRMEMIGLHISSRSSSSSRNEQNHRVKRTPMAKGSKVAAAVWDTLLSEMIKWRKRITPVLCLKYVCRLNDNNDNTRPRHQTPTKLTKRHPLVELLALAAAAAALDLKLVPH
jgi:hypothetical protein